MTKNAKAGSEKAIARAKRQQMAESTADEAPPACSEKLARWLMSNPPRFNFSQEEWMTLPREDRVTIWRRLLEIAEGVEYWHAKFAPFRAIQKYHDMAIASGTTLAEAIEKYMAIEQLWRKDPTAGFIAVAQNLRLNPVVMHDMIAAELGAPLIGGHHVN